MSSFKEKLKKSLVSFEFKPNELQKNSPNHQPLLKSKVKAFYLKYFGGKVGFQFDPIILIVQVIDAPEKLFGGQLAGQPLQIVCGQFWVTLNQLLVNRDAEHQLGHLNPFSQFVVLRMHELSEYDFFDYVVQVVAESKH